MATSKSPSADWTAGAFVFSGRRNPVWKVPARLALRLLGLWDSSKPYSGPAPQPPPLGFRGVFLRDAQGREWQAYGGAIALRSGDRVEVRQDAERGFEKLLLASAPPGAVPRLPP